MSKDTCFTNEKHEADDDPPTLSPSPSTVVSFKTSPRMPAPRAPVENTCARGACIHGVFQRVTHHTHHTPHHNPPQQHDHHTTRRQTERQTSPFFTDGVLFLVNPICARDVSLQNRVKYGASLISFSASWPVNSFLMSVNYLCYAATFLPEFFKHNSSVEGYDGSAMDVDNFEVYDQSDDEGTSNIMQKGKGKGEDLWLLRRLWSMGPSCGMRCFHCGQNGHRLSECPVKDAEFKGKGKGKFGKGNKGKGQVKGSARAAARWAVSRTTDSRGTVGTRARAVKMQARAGV